VDLNAFEGDPALDVAGGELDVLVPEEEFDARAVGWVCR